MKKKYLIIIYSFLLIILLILAFLLFSMIIEDSLYIDIIIFCCLVLTIFIIINLLILEFIGYKKYYFNELNMIIKRKEKVLEVLHKDNINSLVRVVDVFTDELFLITFKYKGKRKVIRVTKENKNDIDIFLNDLPSIKKRNFLYYLLLLFIEK